MESFCLKKKKLSHFGICIKKSSLFWGGRELRAGSEVAADAEQEKGVRCPAGISEQLPPAPANPFTSPFSRLVSNRPNNATLDINTSFFPGIFNQNGESPRREMPQRRKMKRRAGGRRGSRARNDN